MSLHSSLVVIGMVNGMIGGVILVLPLLALRSGVATTGIVLPITGFFSFYSCYLCVKHLGQQSDLDHSLLKHFNNSKIMAIFYDLVVFLNLFLILILYFILIVQQWSGLQPYSIANPLCNALGLFILVFILKYLDFGASILAYGIISIVGYCIFLIWLLASAPTGANQMPVFGPGGTNMAANMGQAFSIQTFFIPVLKRNPNISMYVFYTFLAYVIGGIVYMYIAYAGSFGKTTSYLGILNRSIANPKLGDIEDYFQRGYWQLYCLEGIYLIHLYSVFPQFLLVSKKRVFRAFGLKQTQKGKVPVPQIIYALILIIICLIVDLVGASIDLIITINGAVIGFFFIYFLPLVMHIKCLYFTKRPQIIQGQRKVSLQMSVSPTIHQSACPPLKQQLIQKEQVKSIQIKQQIKQISNINQDIKSINENQMGVEGQIKQGENLDQNQKKRQQQINQFVHPLTCKAQKPSLIFQIIDLILSTGMILIGLFIMVDGIYSLINPYTPT